jgi:hypothetical protein
VLVSAPAGLGSTLATAVCMSGPGVLNHEPHSKSSKCPKLSTKQRPLNSRKARGIRFAYRRLIQMKRWSVLVRRSVSANHATSSSG